MLFPPCFWAFIRLFVNQIAVSRDETVSSPNGLSTPASSSILSCLSKRAQSSSSDSKASALCWVGLSQSILISSVGITVSVLSDDTSLEARFNPWVIPLLVCSSSPFKFTSLPLACVVTGFSCLCKQHACTSFSSPCSIPLDLGICSEQLVGSIILVSTLISLESEEMGDLSFCKFCVSASGFPLTSWTLLGSFDGDSFPFWLWRHRIPANFSLQMFADFTGRKTGGKLWHSVRYDSNWGFLNSSAAC